MEIRDLPAELLMVIFDYLDAVALFGAVPRVCSRWARLARRRVLTVTHRSHLRRLRPALRRVRVRAALPAAPLLRDLALAARHLRDLTVDLQAPLEAAHLRLLASLPHLEHLDVFLAERRCSEEAAEALRPLRSVVLNEPAAPGALRRLAAGRLRALHSFGRATSPPRRALRDLLTARRVHLRELTLRCPRLLDADYACIGECPALEVLQLYECRLMTGAGALRAARAGGLRRLHVTGARLVRRRALGCLVAGLPPLITELVLSVGSFGDEHVAALGARLPGLRALELWGCPLTAAGALELARNLPALSRLDLDVHLSPEHLRELDGHPSLSSVRCLRAAEGEPAARGVSEGSPPNIRVRAADEQFSFDCFRANGEGYRASLIYYWTQYVDLKPLPKQ